MHARLEVRIFPGTQSARVTSRQETNPTRRGLGFDRSFCTTSSPGEQARSSKPTAKRWPSSRERPSTRYYRAGRRARPSTRVEFSSSGCAHGLWRSSGAVETSTTHSPRPHRNRCYRATRHQKKTARGGRPRDRWVRPSTARREGADVRTTSSPAARFGPARRDETAGSERVRTDHLARVLGAEGPPGWHADGVLDEPDATVGHHHVDAAGVETGRGDDIRVVR